MNHASILGRFTRDPELRYTPQGKAVVSFSLAVNRYGDNETDFFDCEAWEKQAENIANSCKKGHRLLVWGRLRQDRWTDQNQQNRSAVRIVVQGFSFIEPPPQQTQGQTSTQPPAGPPVYGPPPGYVQPAGYPGYAPPAPGAYQPPYPGQMAPQQPVGQPPAGQYNQSPAGQYSQPPAQQPAGPPPVQNVVPFPGQQPPGGFSGNLDDVPF